MSRSTSRLIRRAWPLGCALMVLSLTVAADVVIQSGVDFGGDNLIEEIFDTRAEQLEAGGSIHFDIGLLFATFPERRPNLHTQLSLGWKSAETAAASGDITWTRTVIDAIQFRRFKRWSPGIGLTYHINPTLDANAFGVAQDKIRFDNAFGLIVEARYHQTDNLYFGPRVILIRYNSDEGSVSGNSLGLNVGFNF